MKIIAKIKVNGVRAGEPVDVSDELGKRLIARRMAEAAPAERPKPAPKPSKKEVDE